MNRMSRQFTTRRTVLGLPVGRPHTDWAEVRKVGMVGAGAVSTLAGGIRAWSVLPPAVKHLPGQLWGRATHLVHGMAEAVPRPGGEPSVGGPGGDGRGDREQPAGTATRRPAGASGPGRSARKQSSRSTSRAAGAASGARARRDGATRKTGATGKAGATRKAPVSRRAPASRGRQ